MSGLDAHLVVRRGEFDLDIELALADDSTTALLGPNGAGKSTVVDVLAGLQAIESGRITLHGRVLDDPDAGLFVPPEDRRVGVVFQRYLLFDHLTVRDNVAFAPMIAGMRRRDARAVAESWLAALELADLGDARPGELSGGQRQRVALARTLAAEPEMVLLDEPMAALDVGGRGRLRRVLGDQLAQLGGPRLLITHDPTDAFLLADRIHVIEDGRVTQSGTPDDIRTRPATPYVAALAGTNLLRGSISGGEFRVDGDGFVLRAARSGIDGPALAIVHPSAVALHRSEPQGSPRNVWRTTVDLVEALGDTTRIRLHGPMPLAVDVTPASVAELGLAPGVPVWASVKATEVSVHPE